MNETAADAADFQPFTPDPAMRRLDPLVGEWEMTGNFAGAAEETISGRARFRWLDGGFFLVQDIDIDFGAYQVKSHELIGYDADTGAFRSQAYSKMSPVPLAYTWDLRGNQLRISVSEPPMDATLEATISEDGNSFAGGWRPNPGADESVNVAYDVRGTRVA